MLQSKKFKASVRTQLKSIHARVTRNRLTTVFFLFGFLHCMAQGLIQSFLFTVDSQYNTFLKTIMVAGHVDQNYPRNHTNLLGHSGDYQLEVCDFLPHSRANCSHIFDSHSLNTSSEVHVVSFDISHATLFPGPQVKLQVLDTSQDASDETPKTVNVTLNDQCLGTLLYAQQHLQNSEREDIAFLIMQFWLFAISVIAMCYDSVPHVLTILGTRILLTAWSIYALWRTEYQQSIFKQMIEDPRSPCAVEIFPTYSKTRIRYEIPDLVLNCTALGIAIYLSWSLFRVYNKEKVQHIGAPKQINQFYKYFLAVQVCLQLEVFVLLTWMGLWLDQLFNTYIHRISNRQELYEALFIFYNLALGPWIFMGWYGIKHEKRIITGIFISLSTLFTVLAAAMFRAPTFWWTFYVWPCWGCFTTAAIVLLLATTILSVICWRNFDKGLCQYLYAESALASSNFAAEVFERDIEKADHEKTNEKDNRFSYDIGRYLPELSSTTSSFSATSGVH
ncbi:hypothetical protein K435DRAFT_725017 [Dendrothele bispora CBS 962.96]|uniref:Uncharacterized protein n=1 Tax=Dendrothele bispora (strain CBS 962.96) TaxID=1314807 RepID=A0A4S8LVY9_DENBC|nr:hypothetical protein K435DRAFT_725017 [Dendrothele bispora CBS 962.96]